LAKRVRHLATAGIYGDASDEKDTTSVGCP
jgi:hypothetical protein